MVKNADVKELIKRCLAGKATIRGALAKIGQLAAGDVKRIIAAGGFVENAAETILRKGSSKPLINTGQLRQSVTYQVHFKTPEGGTS